MDVLIGSAPDSNIFHVWEFINTGTYYLQTVQYFVNNLWKSKLIIYCLSNCHVSSQNIHAAQNTDLQHC